MSRNIVLLCVDEASAEGIVDTLINLVNDNLLFSNPKMILF